MPAGLAVWTYTPGSGSVFLKWEEAKKKYSGLTVYIFDPAAPAENTKLLPIPYNKLPCPARVLPLKPMAPPPDPAKADAAKAAEKRPAAGGGQAGKEGGEEPPDLPKPIVYPPGKRAPPPPDPPLPASGVTAHWPATVLPVVKRSDSGTVLPTTTVLPMANRSRTGNGENKADTGGTKKGGGVEKTPFEKFAEEMAYAGAVANTQFGEDTKRPDGKRYGIPTGKNANGPDNPVAQAAAGTVLVAAAVISAGGFDKKMIDAFRKKVPLMIGGTGKAAEEAAEKLVEGIVARQGEKARIFLADALNKNGAIGEYSIMKRFTDKLGGRVQAHHILEEKMMGKFKLGNPDKGPAVLLTEAEHKAMTATLKVETARAKTIAELWAGYQRAYAKYPHWLDAIKSYFVQGK